MRTPNRDPSAAQLIWTKTWAAAVVAGAIVTPEDDANIFNAALAASLDEAASTTPDEANSLALEAALAASVKEAAPTTPSASDVAHAQEMDAAIAASFVEEASAEIVRARVVFFEIWEEEESKESEPSNDEPLCGLTAVPAEPAVRHQIRSDDI